VDVRIGVTQAPREISLELAADTDPDVVKALVEEALGGDDRVLWLTDSRGKQVAIPARRIAYVEIGTSDGDRRIGFGS
jgi:hypothetical protein